MPSAIQQLKGIRAFRKYTIVSTATHPLNEIYNPQYLSRAVALAKYCLTVTHPLIKLYQETSADLKSSIAIGSNTAWLTMSASSWAAFLSNSRNPVLHHPFFIIHLLSYLQLPLSLSFSLVHHSSSLLPLP